MAAKPPSKSKSSPKPQKARKSATAGISKKSKAASNRPSSAKQQKTKPGVHNPVKPKRKAPRKYTDQELDLPKLNMITPVGVEKPRGKKKGKIFVDDREGMMTILAMVNAEKEGQIESKMIKARALEEIREARRAEMEKRKEGKKEEFEDVKKGLKRKNNDKKSSSTVKNGSNGQTNGIKSEKAPQSKPTRKRVSFA